MNQATLLDIEDFKASTRAQWDQSAQGWNECGGMIRTWLRASTDAMLDAADVRAGSRVIDIAAGAGDQTLDIAARVGPQGHVLATDISPAILTFAKANAERAGYGNVETMVADGENLGAIPGSFDAAICRLGLMFYPDPLRGLHEMHQALKPGGRACTLVFAGPQANPCIAILVSTALAHAGLPPRDPFRPGGLLSLGKPGLIDDLFRRAGFTSVTTTTIAAPFRLPSVNRYLDFINSAAAPIVQIINGLSDRARAAAWADIEAKLSRFNTPTGWEGPNELLLTLGTR